MKTRTYFLHALSPLHVGIGQSAEIIDLPIARMKGTNIPYVPGSAIKGVLREALRTAAKDENNDDEQDGAGAGEDSTTSLEKNEGRKQKSNDSEQEVLAIFGPDPKDGNDHAGALVCADARLFALPVRSYRGTFAYVTSPLLLALARRDLGAGAPLVPALNTGEAAVTSNSALEDDGKVYLEDLDLSVVCGGSRPGTNGNHENAAECWAALIKAIFGDQDEERSVFTKRFVIVDDETMTFLWDTATQTDTRVRIDPDTRSAANKALWIEESLPPETLLVGMLAAEWSRRPNHRPLNAEKVLNATLRKERVLQFGGKATVGRGRCRIVPVHC